MQKRNVIAVLLVGGEAVQKLERGDDELDIGQHEVLQGCCEYAVVEIRRQKIGVTVPNQLAQYVHTCEKKHGFCNKYFSN